MVIMMMMRTTAITFSHTISALYIIHLSLEISETNRFDNTHIPLFNTSYHPPLTLLQLIVLVCSFLRPDQSIMWGNAIADPSPAVTPVVKMSNYNPSKWTSLWINEIFQLYNDPCTKRLPPGGPIIFSLMLSFLFVFLVCLCSSCRAVISLRFLLVG